MNLRFANCAGLLLLMGASSALYAQTPLGFWRFDEGAGLTAGDSVGANDGALQGAAAFSASGAGHTGVAGDYALNLGGTNNGARVFVDASNMFLDPAATNNQITISFWQQSNTGTTSTSSFWLNSPAAGGQRGAQAHVPWGDGTIYWDTAGCCAGSQRLTIGGQAGTLTNGQWHHLAFVKNGNAKQIWVDGNLVANQAAGATSNLFNFNQLWIGSANGGGNSYNGLIDDFSVYSTALSAASIQAMAAGEFYLTTTGDWNTGTNWDGGVSPIFTDDAFIGGTLTGTVSGTDAANNLTVGHNGLIAPGNGTLNITGNLTVGSDITLGAGGTTGIINVSGGGILNANGNIGTAGGGTGIVNLNDGTLHLGNGSNVSSNIATAGIGKYIDVSTGDSAAIASTISGGSLSKTGDGTLTLSNINTHVGGTTVDGGILALSGDNTPQGTIRGTLTINSGAEARVVAGQWSLGYDSAANYVDTINIDGGTLRFNIQGGTNAQTFNLTGGAIIGNFDLYNSTTAISDVEFNTLASGTTSTMSSTINMRLNGNNAAGGTLKFNVANGAAMTDFLFSGSLVPPSGEAGQRVEKNGAGTMVMNNFQYYRGGTTVNGGVLELQGIPSSQGLISNTLTINSGAEVRITNSQWTLGYDTSSRYVDTININGGTLNFALANGGTNAQLINMTGGAIIGTSFDLYNSTTANGDVAFNTFASSAEATVSSSINLRLNNGAGTGGTVIFDVENGSAANDLVVSGNISGNSTQKLSKIGDGTMVLSGNSSYQGTTTVDNGVLKASSNGALGASGAGQGTTVNNGGSLELANGVTTAEPLSVNGPGSASLGANTSALLIDDGGSATASGPNQIASNATIGAFNGSTLNLDGAIDKNGTTVTFLGNGAATNFININGGVTGAAANSDLIVDNVTTNINSAMNYNGPTYVRNSGVIEMQPGGGIITTALSAGDSGTGTVNHDIGTIDISGNAVIGPASGAATSNYNLSGGTLTFGDRLANTQQSAAPGNPASTLTVGPNGAFNFTGGILENVTTIDVTSATGMSFNQGGGRFVIGVDGVDPNNAATTRAITTITGDYNQSAGTLVVDIFGSVAAGGNGEAASIGGLDPLDPSMDSDLLHVMGDADLDGILEINLNGFTPGPFHWYDVLLADGMIDDSGLTVDGVNLFRVIDNPFGPGQLLQVAVPEPASVALWLLCAAALAGFGYFRLGRKK